MGERATYPCLVDNLRTECLLDSGSQVTLISQSLCHELSKEIHPLQDLVLWHGGGGCIPYLGYAHIQLQFEPSFAGMSRPCSTIALVVQDNKSTDIHPIVVGTNSGVFRSLYFFCKEGQEAVVDAVCSSIYRELGEKTGTPKIRDLPFEWGPVPPDVKDALMKELEQRKEVFAVHEWDVGLTTQAHHEINLTDDTPFRQRSRRVSPADLKDLQDHIQQLLDNGIITESRSPYASPIVLVREKSGALRMCVDYRQLNARTKADQYVVPLIQDAFDCMSGCSWFSVLDLKSGFYQIPMKDSDKEKTAFICPTGFYQFERMPQGVKGAPATFQRQMEQCLTGINLTEAIVYMDDLIVFGRTLEEMNSRLLRVLDRLISYGLKVSPEKCQLCCTSVKYLGHIVSAAGIQTDPSKTEILRDWPVPTTVKEVRSFLGFTGYYRRFVKGYSKIARPLHSLTAGATKKRGKKRSSCNLEVGEPFEERWTQEWAEAFDKLKEALSTPPVLLFADLQKPFVLQLYASQDGLGAVLCQESDGQLHPVAYASRSLSKAERNYPAHKLEFLALKWAVTEMFKDPLYLAKGTKIFTDNNPLTYVLSSARLDATGHRWVSELANYDITIYYRPGRVNTNADMLSRLPNAAAAQDFTDLRYLVARLKN